MSKTPQTIRASLPGYLKDRQEWRRQILIKVREVADESRISYDSKQFLEVEVLLYMTRGKRHDIHDVDNRLKDILDALQGRFRGPLGKKLRLIENDNKICKAVIEKRPTPKVFNNKKEKPGGRVVIRPYKGT